MDSALPRILSVDDEPHVLEGLARQLRRQFAVSTAVGGAAGLELIAREEPFAVVVSDMRMPGMDGAAFLTRVREIAPDATRVLLTGQADLDAAIAAVNQANIFRFLTKPCPPDVLAAALTDAVNLHRLVTSERVLLQETLHGSVKMLTDVLALANPAAFGRATRAKQHVSRIAAQLELADRWQLEVAAMLSQIGCVTLLPETADKVYHGREVTAEERAMLDRLPAVAADLLANIPRLEGVRQIVRYQDKRWDGGGMPRDDVRGNDIPYGARLLKVVLDFDALRTQGIASGIALQTLRERTGCYDPSILAVLETLVADPGTREVEMSLRDVKVGMVFKEDVKTRTGIMLIARGQEVTTGLLERIRNFSRHLGVKEQVWMIVQQEEEDEAQGAVG